MSQGLFSSSGISSRIAFASACGSAGGAGGGSSSQLVGK